MRHVGGEARTARATGAASIGLGLVLAALAGTLVIGALHKAPCTSGDWGDGRQYRLGCYTDIVPLFGTEQLAGGRLPFLDACAPAETNCDEYPVVTMYVMRVAAWISGDDAGRFFWVNALILTVGAAVTASALALTDGRRALWFALAPSLALEAFVNWDLVAVGLAAAGTLAFFRRSDRVAGVLLGLGAAAKLFPALLLVPFAAHRLRERQPDRAIAMWWWAAGAWLLTNVPFAIAAPAGWWEFFRFNAARPVDWDSLWSIACRLSLCASVGVVNVLTILATAAVAWIVWVAKRRREPDFPRWQLAFPILIAFLVLGKVYSPQFTLWLLPWFALAERDLRRFLAFEAADVAVFLTRLWFFGDLTGFGGTPRWLFEAAVVVRALVLVWVVVAWVREPSRAPSLGRPRAAAGATAT
jgi:uncharacterized membrane protein